ncbi:PilC/PilY family type IV pilus protein [Massilia sp. CFBP9012]|uniref:pilus assembly protein n=1 Tax=Massilia sp. CFBP9012 TaxID=3096531 RepID=UPI002A69AE86|nr:PilC/PilY family type IV pilus protein [Massilia sp. CFBP9012]MDY0973612.1 PilC/PilY family type IV pilus protein [Massilia sp. CFBP9012]
MKRLLALLVLLFALPAGAEPTAIAQLPLMNISGSGTVQPNLMLLYDNSGSMNFNYTPDYVNLSSTCRLGNTMDDGTNACVAGYPPFASADFNRQYYDPKVRYMPPLKADGTYYGDLDARATSDWKVVPNDVFEVNRTDLLGNRNSSSSTNLVTGFPDLNWCVSRNSNCDYNRTGYTYPTNQRRYGQYFTANPYYYSINVAEYCLDATLTDCRAATANGGPPTSRYTFPARVRFCNSTKLTTCQAKYVGEYIYPRFSGGNQIAPWYGTISIGSSAGTQVRAIASVTATGLAGEDVITAGAVSADTGTNSGDKQIALARALARSIIDKTGLANQFAACVMSPGSSGVPSCESLGITLAGDNVVGVLPIVCAEGTTGKTFDNCTLVTDNSRAGTNLMLDTGTGATALLRIGGTTHASSTQVISNFSLNRTALFARSLSLDRGKSAAWVANRIRDYINESVGNRGTIRAYVGGDANSSPSCRREQNTTLCVIDSSNNADGTSVSYDGPTNNTSSGRTNLTLTKVAAVSDVVAHSTTGLGSSVFVRTDIVPTRSVYPRYPNRSDCTGAFCTYAQEMTNFANWYGYYKTRNQMMKTSVGQAFGPINDKYNVGLVALSVAAEEGAMNPPKPFAGTDRTKWYADLYDMNTSGATPVRLALHAIGKMYANKAPYEVEGDARVVKFACQQNFTFITTDGYWNGGAPGGIASNDNKHDPSRFCLQSQGCVDKRAQTTPSLADIALYWYNGGWDGRDPKPDIPSLRRDLEGKVGAVPAAGGENNRLHMRTYALGLGVDGIMNYEPNYDVAPLPNGDLYKVISEAKDGCPWNGGGAWVWPNPETGVNSGSAAYQSRVDDLWHAAINGHGKYFSASDPLQVVEGLRSALANIEVKTGAAAAAATSTPNISQNDNDIFSATFTTVRWFGRLAKRSVDVATGEVSPAELWNTSDTLGTRVDASSDERRIYMRNPANGARANFLYAEMDAERAWFDNKCNALTQCASMSAANRQIVNNGANIVNWLRGQQQHADDTVLRSYSRTTVGENSGSSSVPIVLGDIASSKPAYLREPRRNFDRAGYSAYKIANASRAATVFAAANDGMLHAFDADSGEETWAYAPRITMKKLYQLASTTYGTNHIFSVDGSPEVADVKIGGAWKTVLVAGLNAGGRGYYALDVTNPDDPQPLWELCADSAVCGGIHHEPQIGYSFGNPQFGTIKDEANGEEKWVVFLTSGYNNIPGTDGVAGGDGKGYLFVVDIATGRILRKISTDVGSVGTPSGLAKITAITDDPNNDPLVTYVYGGDNTGKMWRFDFTVPGTTTRLLMGDAGVDKPFTTRPEVTACRVDRPVLDEDGDEDESGKTVAGAQRVVVFGSGRLLDLIDVENTKRQSAYVLKDGGQTIGADGWPGTSMVRRQLARIEEEGGTSQTAVPFSISGDDVDLARQDGWYVDFDQNTGERVNLDPKVVAGTVNVVTNLPSSSTECSVGGTSVMYQLNVCTGRAASPDGIAGYPLAASAAVGFIVVRLPSGALKTITTTADGSMVTGRFPPSETTEAHRAGWRRVRD